MESVFQIEIQYIFHIISQDEKSTTYTKNMQKVLKEMVILLHINILQIWRREFNNVHFPKKNRMGVYSTSASLK